MANQQNYHQKGRVMIGLLIAVLFVGAVMLWNLPNVSLTNQVAYAYGGGGGGVTDAVAILTRAANTPAASFTAGGVSGLSKEVSVVVNAIGYLNSANNLSQHKALAVGAVRNLLVATVQVTIQKVQERIAVLLAQ